MRKYHAIEWLKPLVLEWFQKEKIELQYIFSFDDLTINKADNIIGTIPFVNLFSLSVCLSVCLFLSLHFEQLNGGSKDVTANFLFHQYYKYCTNNKLLSRN